MRQLYRVLVLGSKARGTMIQFAPMSTIKEHIAELARGTDEILPEDGLEAKL